jgi:hypothetical protein
MRTKRDRLAPIVRGLRPEEALTYPKIRHWVAAEPSATRKSAGSGSDPEISAPETSARQIF